MISNVFIALVLACLSCQSSSDKGKGVKPPPLTETGESPVIASTPVVRPPSVSTPRMEEPVLPGSLQGPSGYLGDVDPTQNKNLPFGLPEMTSDAEEWIISRPQYVLSWNPKTRIINWAAWQLNSEQFGDTGRDGNFAVDPELEAYMTGDAAQPVRHAEYTGTCFDRGHQVASSDRTATVEDNAATFFMSNIVPQTAFLNQVIWVKLERTLQELVADQPQKNLWVLAGPIYEGDPAAIGPNQDIAVPIANFKAVFSWDEMSQDKAFLVKAVIMPNVLSSGADPMSDAARRCAEQAGGGRIKDADRPPGEKPLSTTVDDYQATITTIESQAKIRFPDVLRP